MVFPGSVPAIVNRFADEHLRDWQATEFWVGCSGGFTVEQHLSQTPGRVMHSNDVILYSDVLGNYFAGTPLDLTQLNPEMRDDYEWLLPFLEDPADADRARHGFEEAEALSKGADARWLARYEDHFRLLDAIATTGKSHDIRNQAAALSYVLDVFEAHRTDLQEGWYDPETGEPKHDQWIPLSTVLGVTDVPASVAAILNKVIQRLISAGDLNTKNRWQVLELLAADFLAGPAE